MGGGCANKNKESAAKTIDTVVSNTASASTNSKKSVADIKREVNAVYNAFDINLNSCYLCAKKHIGRAQQFFEEYHNGYPDHVKNLVDTLFDAESNVYKAFQLWQQTQSQMDMAAGELLGNQLGGRALAQDHVNVAVAIREERLKFDNNPLYVPNFDELRYKIHALQHRVLSEEIKNA